MSLERCILCMGSGNVGEYGPPGGPFLACPACAPVDAIINGPPGESEHREVQRLQEIVETYGGVTVLNRAGIAHGKRTIAAMSKEIDRLRDALRSIAILDQEERPLDTLRPMSASGFDWRRRSLKQEQIAREALP